MQHDQKINYMMAALAWTHLHSVDREIWHTSNDHTLADYFTLTCCGCKAWNCFSISGDEGATHLLTASVVLIVKTTNMFTRQKQQAHCLSLSALSYLICLSPVWSCPCSISADEKQLSIFIFCLHYSLFLSSAFLWEPSWLHTRLVRDVNIEN